MQAINLNSIQALQSSAKNIHFLVANIYTSKSCSIPMSFDGWPYSLATGWTSNIFLTVARKAGSVLAHWVISTGSVRIADSYSLLPVSRSLDMLCWVQRTGDWQMDTGCCVSQCLAVCSSFVTVIWKTLWCSKLLCYYPLHQLLPSLRPPSS